MNKIRLKSKEDIKNLKESGKYLNELLLYIYKLAEPGVKLIELEQKAEEWIEKKGVKGAFKGYQGYPANLCLSVNDCLVHGIPDEYTLKEGDLLKIDAGIIYKGMYSDAAVAKIIGGNETNPIGAELIYTTKTALDKGIKELDKKHNFFDYGKTVEKTLKEKNFKIITYLTGHGVGFDVHEAPHIYNRANKNNKKIPFIKGLTFALEPITAIKSTKFIEKPGNSWNLYTLYGDLGAQREYTLTIGENGIEILAGIQENLREKE